MKKIVSIAILAASAALVPFATLAADASAPASMQAFFDRVRVKLSMITPSRAMTATTAVGGVRGLDIQAEDVYWKGENRASQEELNEFKTAIGHAQEGRASEAQEGMKLFLLNHPKSVLAPEASAALGLLQGR